MLVEGLEVFPGGKRRRPPRPFDESLLDRVDALGNKSLGQNLLWKL